MKEALLLPSFKAPAFFFRNELGLEVWGVWAIEQGSRTYNGSIDLSSIPKLNRHLTFSIEKPRTVVNNNYETTTTINDNDETTTTTTVTNNETALMESDDLIEVYYRYKYN